MTPFTSALEFAKYIAEGKKFRKETWRKDEWLLLTDEGIVTNKGEKYIYLEMSEFSFFEPYTEPPKPLELWVNVYDHGVILGPYRSLAEAEHNRASGFVRCAEMLEVIDE